MGAKRPKAPPSEYLDPDGNVLVLRTSLSAGSRLQYAQIATQSSVREDAWHRAQEFLFERLTQRWEIAGAAIERQRELLDRFRAATPSERTWVRDTLRAHCAEHFPDVDPP